MAGLTCIALFLTNCTYTVQDQRHLHSAGASMGKSVQLKLVLLVQASFSLCKGSLKSP